MTTSILIAEDDALLRTYLADILEREEGFQVVGSLADGREVLQSVRRLQPQVLLLDLRLPGTSGMQVLDELSRLEEPPLTLVLSGSEDLETQVQAARAGARGFLAKSQAAEVLPAAIRAVAGGSSWFDRAVSEQILREFSRLARRVREEERPINRLSEREREVLLRIARGMTNQQIASELFMSVHTVKLHVQNILRKLSLPNRTEAAVFAVQEGLLNAGCGD